MLSDEQLQRFERDGFVKVPGAVPRDAADECAAMLWDQIGAEPGDPATWTKPVEWVWGMGGGPFTVAAQALDGAYDQLVGEGRWEPRKGIGSFPLRFPHDDEPNDAGWHIEGSYEVNGQYWTNKDSKDRLLLTLYLFSEVHEEDAPTRIRVGSHRDVPAVLAPFGTEGTDGFTIGPLVDAASAHRETAYATGEPGDVYLCHPFLVHAAQPHHGTRPRFMAQPGVQPREQITLDRPDGNYSLVERMIRDA